MTKDSIITLPHKSLRERSQKVGLIDDSILKLINNMQSATIDWERSRSHEVGVALAAVQINQKKRVVVIRHDFEDKDNTTFDVLINPVITKLEGPITEDYEGCLSVSDVYGLVKRHNKVKVKALSIDGQEIRVTAEGFLARVLQHEIDHTNGILFVDHIKGDADAFFKLTSEGSLVPLNYETEIRNSRILW